MSFAQQDGYGYGQGPQTNYGIGQAQMSAPNAHFGPTVSTGDRELRERCAKMALDFIAKIYHQGAALQSPNEVADDLFRYIRDGKLDKSGGPQ